MAACTLLPQRDMIWVWTLAESEPQTVPRSEGSFSVLGMIVREKVSRARKEGDRT